MTTAVVGVRAGEARFLGETHSLTAVDPGASKVFNLDWTIGLARVVMETLGADGAFTDTRLREGPPPHGRARRSTSLFPNGADETFTIKGIFDPPTAARPFGVAHDLERRVRPGLSEQPKNLFIFINMQGGETDANTAALEKALDRFPNAKLQNRDEFKDNQISGLKQVLNILYVLLALSVIVSLFGIVNTLVLSVFERTREIGMLRAVGTTRWQIRSMITLESVVTVADGRGDRDRPRDRARGAARSSRVDFLVLAWPIGSLILFAVAAIVVGLIAAILPARRAAQLNVLQALQYE